MRKYAIYAFLALGIAVCLLGAALMAFGEGPLGEDHADTATVIGIVGIGFIGMAGAMLAAMSAKKGQKTKYREDIK